ncbi:hypothetical protein COV04_03235 [Candidatus Uhrbacteria bacterium CG10_big_fil_rev_8_21_14_0_10_48_11]|uniref:STAS/SEC14 domain-containing protein n=1 Tax=Candidatus Uhrbacteria bacterium CG10_big_fil_rev_8_21_14_0_10_48_11 TaxID=1975037 RepID=A0A2M8LE67_9BACT|nr:MAG: hypothetical protein COV04_03235 [Candidatus Uhrbacteria bacterium CG10_big_fil_rev_8_21_14_0_10_48_11]
MQEHQVVLSGDNTIEITLYAEDSPEKAARLVAQLLSLVEEHANQTFGVVVNLSAASHSAEPATLKAYKPAIEHPRIRKIAFVGAIDETQKIFVDFAIKFAQKDSVTFFETVTEAKAWLAI